MDNSVLATNNLVRHINQSTYFKEFLINYIKENPECDPNDLGKIIEARISEILFNNVNKINERHIVPLLEDIVYKHFNYEGIDYKSIKEYLKEEIENAKNG